MLCDASAEFAESAKGFRKEGISLNGAVAQSTDVHSDKGTLPAKNSVIVRAQLNHSERERENALTVVRLYRSLGTQSLNK